MNLTGATFESGDAKIINGELMINASLGTFFGQASFSATLVNDPNGIKVKSKDIKLPLAAGAFKGRIEKYVATLNEVLASRINRDIDPAWETDKFYITPDKLAIDFKKKP